MYAVQVEPKLEAIEKESLPETPRHFLYEYRKVFQTPTRITTKKDLWLLHSPPEPAPDK